PDNLELRIIWFEHHRTGAADIMQLLINRLVAPKAGPVSLGLDRALGRSAFSARFTRLVGQSMHRYVIERRMAEAAFLLETSDEPIARIASRVGYETAAAFSKLFHRQHGLSPGRYRATRRSDSGERQGDVQEAEVAD